MAPPKQIDTVIRAVPRPKEMQILCLGFSRTGTKREFGIGPFPKSRLNLDTALYTALQILGYTPYHGRELLKPTNIKDRHCRCWADGLIGRREGAFTYGVVEFDKLLGQYDERSPL